MVEVDGEETRPLGDPGQSVTDAPLCAAESVDPA